MKHGPSRELRELFERCLEYPAAKRAELAANLAGGNQKLLLQLMNLLAEDADIDAAGISSESGVGHLAEWVLPQMQMLDKQVGPFRVEECIGSGGMGAVYRVRRIDGAVQQLAALKILKPLHINPALLGRFSRERRVLASLVHPGISRFLDAGTLPEGQPFVLMELIEGTPLLEYCDQEKLGLTERLELFVKVLQAVAFAHRKLIVHRDIKSSNVLVTEDGEPKLLDFGIAKNLDDDELDQTGTVDRFLTPRSAAPEQYLGEPVGVGCDIYALGLLLYQLLSGVQPFEFENASAGQIERLLLLQPAPPMSRKIRSAPAALAETRGCTSIEALARKLRGDLDTIVLKCLRKRPEERYGSVEQLEAEIQRVLCNRPIQARGSERWYRLSKFVIRNRVNVGLGSALVLALATVVAVIMVQSRHMAEERSRALIERDRAHQAVSLLQEAFVAADPARVMGGEVTARQILDSARLPLEEIYDSQPELYASLASVLARVNLDLSRDDVAADIARRGLEAAQRAKPGDELLRELWMLKARALTDSREESEFYRAVDMVVSLDTAPQPDWQLALGRRHLIRNQPQVAASHLTAALAWIDDLPGDQRLAIDIRTELATALGLAGRLEEGLALFEQTLEMMDDRLGREHPLTILTRFRRIDALIQARMLEMAQHESQTVQQTVIELYGDNSAMSGRLYATLGRLSLVSGDINSAIEHLGRSREIWLHTLNENHPNVLRSTFNLAWVLARDPRSMADAERLYRQALELAERNMGRDSETALTARAELSRLLAAGNQPQAALEALLDNGRINHIAAMESRSWLAQFIAREQASGCDQPEIEPITAASCRRIQLKLTKSAPD